MSEQMIEAVRGSRLEELKALLAEGVSVNERDKRGWSALDWAAGTGDVDVVKLLLASGADATASGHDGRTPWMIARAAGHTPAAELLRGAEEEHGAWRDPRESQPYCRAYYLEALRRYEDWSEGRIHWKDSAEAPPGGLGARDIVYLHQDFTVTKSMWHGENVIFDRVTPEWKRFCTESLGFAIPQDLL